jgi:hypothetical protein
VLMIGNGQDRARQFIGMIGHRISPYPLVHGLAGPTEGTTMLTSSS